MRKGSLHPQPGYTWRILPWALSGILGCDIHSPVLRSSTTNQGFFVLVFFFLVLFFLIKNKIPVST